MARILLLILFLFFPIAPFAQPLPCRAPPTMTSFCADACIICDIDGFKGRHESTIIGESPAQFAGECTITAHNMQWITFIAGSVNLKVSLEVSNCEQGSNSSTRTQLQTETYYLTITDNNNCYFSDYISLQQPNLLQFDLNTMLPNCEEPSSGRIEITNATGGVPPYNYSINGTSLEGIQVWRLGTSTNWNL